MYRRALILSFTLFALALGGCKKDPAPSIYDPHYVAGAQPIIASIVPENGPYALSGVTTLQLNGSNFSPDISQVVVFFDAVPVQVLSATPTLVRVMTPNFAKDSVKVRVSVIGADQFSPIQYLNIKPAVVSADSIDFTREKPWSVAADNHGNIFVSMTSVTNGANIGVYKFGPRGERSQYALKGIEPFWSAMKVGPGDTVFATRKLNALYFLNPNAVVAPLPYLATPAANKIDDFDYDAQKIKWCGGAINPGIFRINGNKQFRAFAFNGNVRTIRVYNGAVYASASVVTATDTTEAVYQIPINTADSTLGTPVKYFDLTAQSGYKGNKVTALAFDNDGIMYAGIDAAPGIFVVSGANASPVPLYGGLVGPANTKVISFQWGPGTILYVVRENTLDTKSPQVLLKVDMQKLSAPYYGRQ